MCRPNLHMLLSLSKKKLSYETKDSSWELGTSQLLSGYFLPQWLLRVDLCCVWKKSSLLFLSLPWPPTSSSWCPQGCATSVPDGVARGGKSHKRRQSHPFLSAIQEHWEGATEEEEKAKAWPGAMADFCHILLNQTHRAAVGEKMALIYLLPLCKRKLRDF